MLAAILLAGTLLTETPDTLQTAVVAAERGITVSRTDTITIRNSQNITDVLLQSPGLVISDFGGYAGGKSVSLRGLGAQHTTILIDGIKVTNAQSGQSDLNLLDLENFKGAMVDYAQNSVNFSTARPTFNDKNIAGRFAFSGGSFGTFLPQGRLDFRLPGNIALSAHVAGTISKGNYAYGDNKLRENNDIRQIKAGIDLFGVMAGGDWMIKTFYNGADRGTPGSTDWPSTDRQQDKNGYVQGLLRKNISALYSLNIAGKVAYDKLHYISEWGDSDYGQTDIQLNSSHRFRVNNWLELSAVAEFQQTMLKATYYDASRTGITAIAGAKFTLPRFRADITLQYEGTFDKDGEARNVVSPSADIRFAASENLDIVGFARRAYRTPTFNDLYYPGYGNPDLKPEDAWLTDIGIDFHKSVAGNWLVKAKLDGFYNHLTNKITSAPNPDNPSLWLPYNIGEVRSAGFDADAGLAYSSAAWHAGFNARYSFQNAENVPYLSKHTVVLSADASYKGWALNVIWNLRAGRKDSYGDMPNWNTLDMVVGKELTLKGSSLAFNFICRNLADCRYDLVSGYPMQGRSFMGGIEFKF